jgi:hypothetical protein
MLARTIYTTNKIANKNYSKATPTTKEQPISAGLEPEAFQKLQATKLKVLKKIKWEEPEAFQ